MTKTKTKKNTVAVRRADLLAAWAVLENLAVSLDQIGGTYAADRAGVNGAASPRAFREALAGYLTPDLVRDIQDARARLGAYVPDTEAEKLAEKIPYWDYGTAGVPNKGKA